MNTRGFLRRVAEAAACGLLIAVCLASCSSPAPTVPHGARVDVDYSGVSVFDANDQLVGRALYSASPATNLALLSSVLGAPRPNSHVFSSGAIATTRYDWGGLQLWSSAHNGVNRNSIDISAATIHGTPIYALDRYRVRGAFPGDGAHDACSMSVTGLLGWFNKPRVNVITHGDPTDAIGIFEDRDHHGTIGQIEAPQAIELC